MSLNSIQTSYKSYDYIFCGAGASSCLLLRELHKSKLLKSKRILVIDREKKQKNDRSFCFWSEKNEQITKDLAGIISTSWDKTLINGVKTDL
jgi:lycopene beta-cyclase